MSEPRIDQPTVSRTSANPGAPAKQYRAIGRTVLAPERAPIPRAEGIIREAKLKMLQHHYETTFAEFMEIEKALVTASSEEHDTLSAKAKALRGFADKLEDEIRKLGDNATGPATTTQPRKTGNFIRSSRGRPGSVGLAPGGYTPDQATGAPDSGDGGGDSSLAWCMESTTSESDYLYLFYDRPVEIAEVRIHETHATGALAAVVAHWMDESGGLYEHVVWTGNEPVEKTPAVRVITAHAGIKANRLRLDFQTRRIQSWQEIDAVELVGRDGSRQWASQAEASSYWGHGRTSLSSEVDVFGSSGTSAQPGEGSGFAPSPEGGSGVSIGSGGGGTLEAGAPPVVVPGSNSSPK